MGESSTGRWYLSRSDFAFDKEKNEYRCPNGKPLRTTGRVHDRRTILYRASKRDCDQCSLKARCCQNVAWRKIPRDVNEEARGLARALMKTPEYERSRDERKRVEMRFAHLKTHHRFERLRLCGLTGARDDFHLAAIAQKSQNLREIHHATTATTACARHRVTAIQLIERSLVRLDRDALPAIEPGQLKRPRGLVDQC